MKPISLFDSNSVRVIRGGSWYDPSRYVRVAIRISWMASHRFSDLGFRLYMGVR